MKYGKTRKCMVSFAMAALMLAGAVITPLLEVDANAITQEEINRKIAEKNALKGKIKDQQSKVNDLKNNQADYMERKNALDEQQELAMQEILLIQEQLEMYRQMIEEKEEEARIAQENADAQLEIYKKHIRSMEEQGVNNMFMALLFSSEDFGQLISRIDMVGEIMAYDKRVEDEYKTAKAAAMAAKEEYEASVAELAVQEEELQGEIDALQVQMDEAQKEINLLQSNIDEYSKVIAQYVSSEKAIDAEIKKMQDELKRQQKPPTATGSYMWPSPSCWLVTSKYGMRELAIYGYPRMHAGVDIGASAGSAIVAADGGIVTTSTNGGGYGNYVMINHGDGRSTLYAHMSARAVFVNDEVTKGQVIGYVGSTGNSTGPHLHFEVRINGGTVDPLKYFSGYTYVGR